MLADSFLNWQSFSAGPLSKSFNMWHRWGLVVALTLLVLLAWEAARSADVAIKVGPLSPSMVTLALSVLLAAFTLIKVLSNDFVTTWAWLGFALTIVVAVGAWLNLQAVGPGSTEP